MDLQDPRVQKLLLAIILSASAVVFFFFTDLMPVTYQAQNAQIIELRTEHERLSRELERARLTVGNMAKVEREFEYLHKQWIVAQRLLPDDNEISGLLRKISAAGTQAGLDWVEFVPAASMTHGFYRENPVQVKLEGGYHQVGSFLSSIANLGRIVNVRSLDIEGVRAEQQDDPEIDHTLTATMQVVAYSIDPNATLGAPADASSGDATLSAGNGARPGNQASVATRAQAGGR